MAEECLDKQLFSEPDLLFEAEQTRKSWEKTARRMGTLYPDDTILVIEFDNEVSGLGDYVRTVNGYLQLADLFGWIPVVFLSGQNQYLQDPQDNMWEYYFDPVSELDSAMVMQCASVIFGRDNGFGIEEYNSSALFRKLTDSGASPRLRVRADLLECWEQLLPKEMKDPNTPVMGIIARGTDLAAAYHQTINLEATIQKTNDVLLQKGYAYLFLATEDSLYFQEYQKAFRERLLYVDQKRISIRVDEDGAVPYIYQFFQKECDNMRSFGERYLMITWFLSHCREIYTTFFCGASFIASLFTGHTVPIHQLAVFQGVEDISKRNLFQIQEDDREQRCRKAAVLMQKHGIGIIYGTGTDAQQLLSLLQDTTDIIFCDRKAEDGLRLFREHPVITQTELVKDFSDKRVLIMSMAYEYQIREQLKARGFPESQIFLPLS